MRIWIRFNGSIQSIKYQRIIVAVPDNECNDSAVVQIKDRTEIHLVYNRAFVPLEFCHICQPLLVGHAGMELAVQPVLCNMLRIGSLSGTAIVLVLNGRLDIQATANTQHSLLIYI